jgi:hypothetical protein
MGAYYSLENATFSQTLPTTLYQSVGVSYGQRFSSTWSLSAAIGASTSSAKGGRDLVLTGLFSAIKSFRASSLAFTYYRGADGGLQVTNSYSDRLDVAYTRTLSARIRTTLGGGYYREFHGGTDSRGAYVSPEISYQLTPTVSTFLLYAYKNQQNGGVQLFTGTQQYVAVGILWAPGRNR